jgi:hypothetical protein
MPSRPVSEVSFVTTTIPSVVLEIQWDAPAPQSPEEGTVANASLIAGGLKKLSQIDVPHFRPEVSAWAGSEVPDFGDLTFADLFPYFEENVRAEDLARLHSTNPLYPESSRQAFRDEVKRIVDNQDLREMAKYVGQGRIDMLLGRPSLPVTVEELKQLNANF